MTKRPQTSPRFNLQVDCPPTLVDALDIIAYRAKVRRAPLIRAILAEYVELKLGPKVRRAIAEWEKHGSDVLHEFMKQQVGDVDAIEAPPDPKEKFEYRPEIDLPGQENDLVGSKKRLGRAMDPHSVADSLTAEFTDKHELQPPTLTESELVAADPSRSHRPLPEHFPVKQEVDPQFDEEPVSDDTDQDEPFLM
jgi:hypothetical protein